MFDKQVADLSKYELDKVDEREAKCLFIVFY